MAASDSLIQLASAVGCPTTLYATDSVPYTSRQQWQHFAYWSTVHSAVTLSMSLILFLAIRFLPADSYRRAIIGSLGFVGFTLWPVWLGDTGIPTLNFGVPALSFLVTLHIVDIFVVRSPEQVQSWGLLQFMAQLLAFPNESKDNKVSRMYKNTPWFFIKAAMLNLTLYFVPSPHIFSTLAFPSIAFYSSTLSAGLIIMLYLGLMVDSTLVVIGTLTQIEMLPLFANPVGSSTSLREFWAKWNLAVKDSLGRAVFKLVQSSIQTPLSRRFRRDIHRLKNKQWFDDHLNETEIEIDSTVTSPYGSDGEQNNGLRSRKKPSVNTGKVKDTKQVTTKAGMNVKVLAALFTFLISGIYHEQMIWVAFGRQYMTGENLSYFLIHGFVMCVTVVVGRKCPNLRPKNPWMSWALLLVFLTLTTPLFVGPFLRFGFFEHLKAASLFNGFNPVGGFIWIAGQP